VAPASQPWEVAVPNDAQKIEIWFNNTDQTGCTAWDSRYGQTTGSRSPEGNAPAAIQAS
jgi:Family of unknown function (DUF6209)